MDDPCRNTFQPISLVMRKMECFYCGATDTGAETIDRLTGIKYCGVHKEAAIRDCNAYLHRIGSVRIEDAFKHPVLSKFILVLKDNSTFPVIRTDGSLDTDWSLETDSWYNPTFISRNENKWSVPVKNPKGLSKYVPIIKFLNPEICGRMLLPNGLDGWSKIIDEALDQLIDGVYRADQETYERIFNADYNDPIPEMEGTVFMNYNGYNARILLPRIDETPSE